MALSEALRSTIPMMTIVDEMAKYGIQMNTTAPRVHCRVFEDNSGALEMATVHKFRPRTKHLASKWHFFRSYVSSNKGVPARITIHKIDTLQQPADTLTKPLSRELFEQHRLTLLGW